MPTLSFHTAPSRVPPTKATPSLAICLNEFERESFLSRDHFDQLAKSFPDTTSFPPPQSGAELIDLLETCRPDCLLASWSLPALPPERSAIPSLRYICYLAGSIRRKVPKTLIEQGLTVTNWGDRVARTVAECALMLALMSLREASSWAIRMHLHGAFKKGKHEGALSLFERSVGIHGFGAVARALVPLLQPFGCPIAAYSPGPPDEAFAALNVTRCRSLDELFASSDVVFEMEGYHPGTASSVREHHLRQLGDGVFVNVARGEIVDETALLNVARQGRLRIGLDVYHQEPLPADSPLRGLANVTLLPHIGGPTAERRVDAGALAVQNLQRFLSGQPLEAVITPDLYDRMS